MQFKVYIARRHDSPPFTYRQDEADPTTVTIRKVEARDEKRWRELWNGVARVHIHRDRNQATTVSVTQRPVPLFKRSCGLRSASGAMAEMLP
jgi:hypothetical protein